MKDWTEEHIREIIRDELKKIIEESISYERTDRTTTTTTYEGMDRTTGEGYNI